MSNFEELVGVTDRRSKWCDRNLLPVQCVIRTFLEKKFWRLESLFLGNCMDNANKFADKWGAVSSKPATVRNYMADPTGLESTVPLSYK